MMTNTQLATASLDDIVFDGRNRGYGAYELRALYQRHMSRALVIATAMCALLLAFPLVAQLLKDKTPVVVAKPIAGQTLMPPPLAPDAVVTPPPPAAAKPPVQPPQPPTVKDLVPVVVDDKKAPEQSEVPNHEDLIDKAPGLVTAAGKPGADLDADLRDLKPSTGSGADVGETVAEKPYTYVEQMPQLPGGGGTAAIVAAIQKAARYPAPALSNQIEGRIFVSFVVNPQGEVSEVKVVQGLGYGLDEETVRAVKSLPRFIPGKQNGRAVSVAFTVPVSFKIR